MLGWLRRILGRASAPLARRGVAMPVQPPPLPPVPPTPPFVSTSIRSVRHPASFIDGRYYVEWAEAARHLEWMGDVAGARRLLTQIVVATEAESAATGEAVAPFAYERLAIIARNRRDCAAELAILERFARQRHASGALATKLLVRLQRLREMPPSSLPLPPLAAAPGPFWLRYMPAKVLFVDVETTGLGPRDRIVSLAAIMLTTAPLADNRIDFRFAHYICDPGRRSHPYAGELHGYSDWMLRHQQAFAEIAPAVAALIGECDQVAAHNAEFDISFIDAELVAAGLPAIDKRRSPFCTMQRYSAFYSGHATLDTVAAHIGLARAGRRHGALEDAWLAMMIYLWLHGCPHRVGFAAFAPTEPSNMRPAPPQPSGELPRRKRVPPLKAPRAVRYGATSAPANDARFGPCAFVT